jgi:uncharacterized protein YbcI
VTGPDILERQIMSAEERDHQPPADHRGELLATISSRVVQLHKHFYGKGPEKARTYYQDDLVVVLMRGGFSRVEETLLQAGRADAVTQQRMQFQRAMEHSFKELIGDLTGREVVAFMSGTHQHPDLVAEVFVLAPNPIVGDG